MTEDQARDIIRQIAAVDNKQELQKLIGRYISVCDNVFFSMLSDVVKEKRSQGDEANARKLQEIGDAMARLRFLI
jgi:DNA-binding FrmR family transcriptional regulator